MSGRAYLTDLGRACERDVKKHPLLLKYYDPYASNICIPLSDFVNDIHIRQEAFSLLGSKTLTTFNACWAMMRDLIGDENGEMISGVVITQADKC